MLQRLGNIEGQGRLTIHMGNVLLSTKGETKLSHRDNTIK